MPRPSATAVPRVIPPCALCGTAAGPIKDGAPRRYNLARYGQEGKACHPCYARMLRRLDAARRPPRPERPAPPAPSPLLSGRPGPDAGEVGPCGRCGNPGGPASNAWSRRPQRSDAARFGFDGPPVCASCVRALQRRRRMAQGGAPAGPARGPELDPRGEAYEAAKAEARKWYRDTYFGGRRGWAEFEAEDRDPLRGPWRADPGQHARRNGGRI